MVKGGALLKKSIQDMKKSLPQFISIYIMASVAMTIVVGLDSIWKTVEVQANQMYATTNASDFWVTVPNPTEADLWKVRKLPGVEKAEKRLTVDSEAQVDGEPMLKVYASPPNSTLDLPEIQAGTKAGGRGAVLDEPFAKAHHLSVGDSITIKIGDKKESFRINALAFSSEHVFAMKTTGTQPPDPSKYGFIVVDEDRLTSFYGGFKPYNQISVKLEKGADEAAVMRQLDTVFPKRMRNIITRTDSRSFNMVSGKIQQFQTLSTVFPIIFFIVTALITFSTMVRLVEDQRSQIGLLKALGYSKRKILWHYTSYGLYVGLLGSLAGCIIGPNLIGRVLLNNLSFLFTFPSYQLSLNVPNIILNTLIIVACTGGVSYYSCLKLQSEMPSTLLRDKPPKKGNHIFLERFPKLWNRMKFSSKLIARNTTRNKFRMAMSILGVMGCTGLIIGAFTLYDMVTGISKTTYEKLYTYDQKVILDPRTTDRDIKNLQLDGVVQDVEEGAVLLTSDAGMRRLAVVTVYSKDSPLLRLEDADGNKVDLPDSGIAMTRKMAELLRVKVGDEVNLKRSDDTYVPVRVEKLVYMVSGQGIYMTDDYWEKIGEDFKPTSILVKWNHEDESFLQSDYVSEYVSRTKQRENFDQNLTSVYIAAFMLISAGGILAFIVLYNMGILNFFERVRDLATLEVLGFRQKEIRPLVLMENIFSALIGIVFGVPVGWLITYVFASGFGDEMDMIGHLTPDKVLLAAVITMIFAIIVNSVVIRKIKTIDMLQALKSVE